MKHIVAILALAASMFVAAPASALIYQFLALQSGTGASPPNTASADGNVMLVLYRGTHDLHVMGGYHKVTGYPLSVDLHCCTESASTGVSMVAIRLDRPIHGWYAPDIGYGTWLDLLDPAIYQPTFLAAHGGTGESAETALLDGLFSERAYMNIPTDAYPEGEIRGFFLPIPEPSAWAMLALGVAGLGLRRKILHSRDDPGRS